MNRMCVGGKGRLQPPAGVQADGAIVEVQFADNKWYIGQLVEPLEIFTQPRWLVHFDDGEKWDDIRLSNPMSPVRFPYYKNGVRFEVRGDDQVWRDGMMLTLLPAFDYWGV